MATCVALFSKLGVKEGWGRERGREGARKGGSEGARKGGSEGGRERARGDGGRMPSCYLLTFLSMEQYTYINKWDSPGYQPP